MTKKIDQRLDSIVETARVLGETERERTDVKTSTGRLAGEDVPFMISYITQMEAVIEALTEEKAAMEAFDAAMVEKDEEKMATLSQQLMVASRAVENALEDLNNWKNIVE